MYRVGTGPLHPLVTVLVEHVGRKMVGFFPREGFWGGLNLPEFVGVFILWKRGWSDGRKSQDWSKDGSAGARAVGGMHLNLCPPPSCYLDIETG